MTPSNRTGRWLNNHQSLPCHVTALYNIQSLTPPGVTPWERVLWRHTTQDLSQPWQSLSHKQRACVTYCPAILPTQPPHACRHCRMQQNRLRVELGTDSHAGASSETQKLRGITRFSPSWESDISSIKTFPALYGTRKLITEIAQIKYLSLSLEPSI
jgi:hypothetical protein